MNLCPCTNCSVAYTRFGEGAQGRTVHSAQKICFIVALQKSSKTARILHHKSSIRLPWFSILAKDIIPLIWFWGAYKLNWMKSVQDDLRPPKSMKMCEIFKHFEKDTLFRLENCYRFVLQILLKIAAIFKFVRLKFPGGVFIKKRVNFQNKIG